MGVRPLRQNAYLNVPVLKTGGRAIGRSGSCPGGLMKSSRLRRGEARVGSSLQSNGGRVERIRWRSLYLSLARMA